MYHRSWTVRDGLPNGILDGVQGPDGFLWFTTGDGLYRFDGVTFERYQPPAGKTLVSDRMGNIIVAHDGAIWVTYLIAGVTRIKGDQITNFTEKEGLRPGHTGHIAEDKDGRIWVASTGGLQFIQNNRISPYVDDNGIGSSWSEGLMVDRDGNLWMPQIDQGVMVLKRGARNFLSVSKGRFTGCVLAHGSGVLCTGDGLPLTYFALTGSSAISRPLMKPDPNLTDVFAAPDGTIWLGNGKHGVQRFTDRPDLAPNRNVADLESFGRESGLSGQEADRVFKDTEGSTWVITNRGLDQFRPVPFHKVPVNGPHIMLPSNRPTSNFFIATTLLGRVIDGRVSYLTKGEHENARCLYQADDGTVYVGGWGLQRYRNGKLKEVDLPIPKDDQIRVVLTVVEDSSHRIWANVGTAGLFRLDDHGWTKQGGVTGFPETGAYAALRTLNGDLWFGYRKSVLARLSSGHVTRFNSSTGLNLGDIRVLTERNGDIWVGGDQGIAVFHQGKFLPFTLRDGKQLRGVSGLVFLPNGDLWLNSGSGVLRISHEEVSKWDLDAKQALQWRLFDYLDGVDGIPELFSGNPTVARAPDGTLYFTVGESLQRIDPLHMPVNPVVPQVWVTNMATAEGNLVVSSTSPVRSGPDLKGLEIRYTAPSLLIPERVRFRYQLVGYDKDWIYAGARRQAFYSKVPAGNYTFRVMASNDSGVWSVSPATITLVVPPTWVETIWFKIAIAVLLVILVYMAFRLRMQYLKRQLTERLNERFAEREKIARDLHDNLFQGVEGGLLLINSVTSRVPMEAPAKQKLSDAFQEINLVMASARNLIFDQSQSTESLDLEGAIELYGEEVGMLADTRFIFSAFGRKRPIKAEVSEELLKIVKEAVSNAFRHAVAKEVEVQIVYAQSGLEVCVCDDGIGIDPLILEEGGRQGHWGIRSMRQRAEKVGGQLKVSRRKHGGTEVSLRVRGSAAFRSRAAELSAGWFR